MGDAAQAGFDAADDDGWPIPAPGLAQLLAVYDDGAIRPLAGLGVRRIGIVAAWLAIGGIVVDHRIHVAGGHAEEQGGPAQRAKGLWVVPVRLRDDADAKALGLEAAPDHGHAEAGMIDVGIAGDQDDVAGIPAQLVHFLAAHRQDRRRREAMGPVTAPVEQATGRSGNAAGCGACSGHGLN